MARAKSPDGREWEIKSVRERFSLEGAGSLGSVVVTVILVALIIVLAIWSPLWAIVGGVVLLIWLIERVTYLARPRLFARTPGPPPHEIAWKATGRFGHGELEQRVAHAIEAGNPDSEPPGLRLIEP
jgi:uncharacterized membrane protein YkgB